MFFIVAVFNRLSDFGNVFCVKQFIRWSIWYKVAPALINVYSELPDVLSSHLAISRGWPLNKGWLFS